MTISECTQRDNNPSGGNDLIALLVEGDCMEPGIKDGAVVAAVPGRSVRVGDVVAMRVFGKVTLHRVVARIGAWIVHQGDRGVLAGVARARDVIGHIRAPSSGFVRTRSAWFLILGVLARHLGLGQRRPLAATGASASRGSPRPARPRRSRSARQSSSPASP